MASSWASPAVANACCMTWQCAGAPPCRPTSASSSPAPCTRGRTRSTPTWCEAPGCRCAAECSPCWSNAALAVCRLGIVTTTSRSNVQALLGAHLGEQWAQWFSTVVCGEDVQGKKPDPEAYLRALQTLRIGPLDAVAIEDSPGGVAAARAACVPVVVTRSSYFAGATLEGAIAIGPGLHSRKGWRPALPPSDHGDSCVSLHDIEDWHAQMDTVSQYG